MVIQKQYPLDIKKLIDEARDLGYDIHDYVAVRLYGRVTPETRADAKNAAFAHLYGGHFTHVKKADRDAAPNFQNTTGMGKAARNLYAIAEMSEAAKKVFDSTYSLPNVQGTSFAVQVEAVTKRVLDTFAKHSRSKEMQDLYDSVDTSREDAALQRLADTPLKLPPPVYKQYTIKVKGDDEYSAVCYSVPALSAQAARVLAFALYGGFGTFKEAEPVLQDDDIELALLWTEVIV
jgi:hypothetical protein